MTWPLEWATTAARPTITYPGQRTNASRRAQPRVILDPARLAAAGVAAPDAPPARAAAEARSWYRIAGPKAQADGSTVAEIVIYDEIGWWGTTAADFVAELKAIVADALDLRLSSPGGDVFDGLAIYNALVDHPANVTVYVDGIAASIASVIAQAGDRVVMGPNSQMMIHEAWGVAVGNAEDMREMAELLDRQSQNIADVYATRTDVGTADEWRETMRGEQWYSADEAVEAGLADEAVKRGPRSGEAPPQDKAPDLSRFKYAGRDEAPAPTIRPAAHRQPPAPVPAGGPEAPAAGPGGGAGADPGPTAGDPPAPAADTDGEDVWADVPDDVFAGIGDALAAATEEPFEWDAEAFAASLQADANNAPAPTESPAEPEPVTIDTFVRALQEALQ